MFQSRRIFQSNSKLICRHLYTNDFLSLSIVKEKQDLLKQELKERGQKHSLVVQQVTNLMQNNELLSQDMTELILSSRSSNDLKHITELFQRYILNNAKSDTITSLKRNAALFKDLVSISHIQDDMQSIHPLFKDEVFLAKIGFIEEDTGHLGPNIPAILNIYLDHIYELGNYQEVISQIDDLRTQTPVVPWPLITLALMSCLRLNTHESFVKASEIFHSLDDKYQVMARIAHPYALLAHFHGETIEAYEVVSSLPSKTVIKTGLLVTFLTKLNRINDALRILEVAINEAQNADSPLARRGEKIIFSLETVKELTEAVEAKDKATQVKLARIYKRLDSVAAISHLDLIEIVAGPIDVTKNMKYRREKNRFLRAQKKDQNAFLELEEECESVENEVLDTRFEK